MTEFIKKRLARLAIYAARACVDTRLFKSLSAFVEAEISVIIDPSGDGDIYLLESWPKKVLWWISVLRCAK